MLYMVGMQNLGISVSFSLLFVTEYISVLGILPIATNNVYT